MIMKSISSCLVLSLLIAFSAEDVSAASRKKKKKKAEEQTAGAVIHAKSPKHDIPFSYYVPQACAKSKNVPLVVSYHGAGGSGQGEIKGWSKLAEKHGFIAACPTSLVAGHGVKAGTPMRVSEPGFVREAEAALSIVAMLKEKYSIDPRKVMVTGFSGGGNPSYWLGLFHGKVFRFLCTRCGNWPTIINRLTNTNPEKQAAAKWTGENNRIYIYWGERDHPIILGSIKWPLAYMEHLKPAHYRKEMIPGMGHSSSASRAVAWFLESIEAAKEEWAKQDIQNHKDALAAGNAALEKKEIAEAVKQFTAARDLEGLYKKLGKGAATALRKIEQDGKKWFYKAKSLVRKKDPSAEKALSYVATTYQGTKLGDDAAKALADYRQKNPKKEAPVAAE